MVFVTGFANRFDNMANASSLVNRLRQIARLGQVPSSGDVPSGESMRHSWSEFG
jgi:hypothetical protein